MTEKDMRICNQIGGDFETKILTNGTNKGTKKYAHVKTEDVVTFFQSKGWTKLATSAKNPTKQDNEQYHIVVLENRDMKMPNGTPRIIVGNSYNTQRCLEINLGFFNFTCANGIIAGENLYHFKKKHKGKIELTELLENEYNKIAAKLNQMREEITRMQAEVLTPKEKFVKTYRALRLAEYNLEGRTINWRDVLTPKREEERENNTWNVLNIVQEKMIRDGIKTIEGRKIPRARGNKRTVETNKAVWTAFAA